MTHLVGAVCSALPQVLRTSHLRGKEEVSQTGAVATIVANTGTYLLGALNLPQTVVGGRTAEKAAAA